MSRLYLVLFSLIIFGCVSKAGAQTLRLTAGDWETVQKLANEQNRYVFIDCYTEWCGWCKVMDKSTFKDSAVVSFMNEHFIMQKLDMEQPENALLGAKYRVSGFPGYLLFNSSGYLVYRFTGYMNPENFMNVIHKALNPDTQMKFPGISNQLNPGFSKEYLSLFGTADKPNYKESVADSLLDLCTDLFDEVSWAILYKMAPSRKYRKHFLNNLAKYTELYPDEAKDHLETITHQYSNWIQANKREDHLDSLALHIQKYYNDPKEIAATINYYKKEYYLDIGNWEQVKLFVQEGTDSGYYASAHEINSDCWRIYERCSDQSLLELAERMIREVTNKTPDYFTLDTHGALLSKLDRKAEAIQYLERAIAAGKQAGEEVDSTEELLANVRGTKATDSKK